MSFRALVLSADALYGRGLAEALEHRGLEVRRPRDWREAGSLLAQEPAVVVLDDDCSLAPSAEILSVAGRNSSPVIVVARDLDAARWVYLFRQGAFDVLRAPIDPGLLRDSVWAALGRLRPRHHQKWVQGAMTWARSALFQLPRP